MNFVFADVAGRLDSPLYGMFAMRSELKKIVTPGGGRLVEHFISQPTDAYRDYAIKWDGEWQSLMSNSGPWRCPAFAKKRWADLLFAGQIQRLIFHLRTSASSADKVSWRLDRSAVVPGPPSKNTSADDADGRR